MVLLELISFSSTEENKRKRGGGEEGRRGGRKRGAYRYFDKPCFVVFVSNRLY